MAPEAQALPSSTGSMPSLSLVEVIVSQDPSTRNLSLHSLCEKASCDHLLQECQNLERFRHQSLNLYERVRACFFLYAIHRFHLSESGDIETVGEIPYEGFRHLQERQFEDAIQCFLKIHTTQKPNQAICSALAKAYYHLGFQTLADQVRSSVSSHGGNAWMFEIDDVSSYPYQIHPDLLQEGKILQEQTPVRMDLSHCGWSDIFFLAMDQPECARVLNISVDLAVQGRHDVPQPPIDCFIQVIDEPVLRLTSIDLAAEVTLTRISEVFEFAKDYLGLLRAGIVASGIVPLGLEHSDSPLADLFSKIIGPNKGLHLTTRVNDIPKGSRLAVSTNLLSSIIALSMRATGQTTDLVGSLTEDERRLVAARAILGEWLGGSGGGWQDSGGVWPGIKLIEGCRADNPSHPEHGISRGRLLPLHRQLSNHEAPQELVQSLQDHLVLVHGGMAQNVGPVLEMVTEKYLLRDEQEWNARQDSLTILDQILEAFQENNIPKLADLTTRNFFEPLQTIIPWTSNLYTETLIGRAKDAFGGDMLGFWQLGGCSGGGMGFMFTKHSKQRALKQLPQIMLDTKRELETALPFAMDPVVYDFEINQHGTRSNWSEDGSMPKLTSGPSRSISEQTDTSLDDVLEAMGFDPTEHENIRSDYINHRIGLSQNRLPKETVIANVSESDVLQVESLTTENIKERGMKELQNGTVGVVTLAAGVGSRWSGGAGCVKAIHPFCSLSGQWRTFLEIHLAKSRKVSDLASQPLPHVITTSYMTDEAIQAYLDRVERHAYEGPLYISKGQTVGIRLVPTIKDLDFTWDQEAKLDNQAQKVKESGQKGLRGWVKSCGEGTDYTDNKPMQCLHPVGHFYEVPNLLLNGTLKRMLDDRPQLKYLMLHNVDTVGANVDPVMLGLFLEQDTALGFEVISKRVYDTGGGLAKVNGKVRMVEGLALPREEDEFKLLYYNSMTTWIDIDKLLTVFGLCREDLDNVEKVSSSVHEFSKRLPTYVALKEVKKRWGQGQEDVFPTAQFEKLWSDITSLDEVDCSFFVVPRTRGNQLKDVSQLDPWVRDGSAQHLESICSWS